NQNIFPVEVKPETISRRAFILAPYIDPETSNNKTLHVFLSFRRSLKVRFCSMFLANVPICFILPSHVCRCLLVLASGLYILILQILYLTLEYLLRKMKPYV